MSERTRFDLHQTLTDQIVAAIERVSADDFRLPWHRSGMSSIQPKNALTKNAYRGINIVSLWVAAEVHQYPHALWASYKQWQELGAQVRKGERSSLVVFYKEYETEPDPKDEDDDGKRRVARHSSVFNVAQVDGFALPDTPSSINRRARRDGRRVLRRNQSRHPPRRRARLLSPVGRLHPDAGRAFVPRLAVRHGEGRLLLRARARGDALDGARTAASTANSASASAIISIRRKN